MEIEFKRNLPGTLQALVDEIETAAHREIVVEHVPNLSCGAHAVMIFGDCGQPGATPDSLQLILKFKGDPAATNRIFREPYGMMLHELLHMRRWIVEQIPCLHFIEGLPPASVAPDEDPVKRLFTTAGIDELIEHIGIEQAMPTYGFEGHHRASFQEVWDSFPSQPWKNWAAMRWVVLQEWIRVVFMTRDSHLWHHAEGVMRRFGMLDEARQLTDWFKLLLSSPDKVNAKYGMTLMLAIVFRIPPENFRFLERRQGWLGHRGIPTAFEVRTDDGERACSWQAQKRV